MKDMKKRGKGRTWADAAKMVLERNPKKPMSHKEILRIIMEDGLKDTSGTVTQPLLCLNSCLHANSRGTDCMFYKVAGKVGVYGLMSDLPDGATLCEMDEDSDSYSELMDESGKPITMGSTSSRSFSEKRKDKVTYLKLPKGCDIVSGSDEMSGVSGAGASEDTSSNATASISDLSENLSEAPSTDTLSTTSSRDVGREEIAIAVEGAPSTSPIDAARLAAARRKNRNNPLRHYTKRRRKKKGFSRIKQHNSVGRLSGGGKNLSSVSGMVGERTRSASSGYNPVTGIAQPKRQTLREMLSKLPGFSFRPKFRRNQKLSHAAQIRQTKEGCIDLETPNSILVNMNLKEIVNKESFAQLPPNYQYQLLQLLPVCDRQQTMDNSLSLSSTALNNEFFTKACTEWISRLSEGEFTQETQTRIKMEEDRQKQKLDPWKVKHFEAVWGHRSNDGPVSPVFSSTNNPLATVKNSGQIVPVGGASPPAGVQAVPGVKARRDSDTLESGSTPSAVGRNSSAEPVVKKQHAVTVSKAVSETKSVAVSDYTDTSAAINVLRELKRAEPSPDSSVVPSKKTRLDSLSREPPLKVQHSVGSSQQGTTVQSITVTRATLVHHHSTAAGPSLAAGKPQTYNLAHAQSLDSKPQLQTRVSSGEYSRHTVTRTLPSDRSVVGKTIVQVEDKKPVRYAQTTDHTYQSNSQNMNVKPCVSHYVEKKPSAHHLESVERTHPSYVKTVHGDLQTPPQTFVTSIATRIPLPSSSGVSSLAIGQIRPSVHGAKIVQQTPGRTRTLAEIKAKNRFKAQNRAAQFNHLPAILQQAKRGRSPQLSANQQAAFAVSSAATNQISAGGMSAEGVNVQRSEQIVQREVQQALLRSQTHSQHALVRYAQPSVQSSTSFISVPVNTQRVTTVRSQLPSTRVVTQQVEQHRSYAAQSTTKTVVTLPTASTSVATVLPGSFSRVTAVARSQDQGVSQPQTTVYTQTAGPSSGATPVETSSVDNTTALILPSQAHLATTNPQVFMVDPKNSEAAGGKRSQSTSSFAHQPVKSEENECVSSNTVVSSSPDNSLTVRVSSASNVSTTVSAAISTSSSTVPKIKFIRVTSADGEIQYVLSSSASMMKIQSDPVEAKCVTRDGDASRVVSKENKEVPVQGREKSEVENANSVYKVEMRNSIHHSGSNTLNGSLKHSVATPATKSSFSASHPSLQKLLAGEKLSKSNLIGVSQAPRTNNAVNSSVISKSTTGTVVHAAASKQTVPRSGENSALLQALNNNHSGAGGFTHHSLSRAITSTLNSDANHRKPVSGIGAGTNCMCDKKALVMCKKCGAFCHDDCIPLKLCVACLMAR